MSSFNAEMSHLIFICVNVELAFLSPFDSILCTNVPLDEKNTHFASINQKLHLALYNVFQLMVVMIVCATNL